MATKSGLYPMVPLTALSAYLYAASESCTLVPLHWTPLSYYIRVIPWEASRYSFTALIHSAVWQCYVTKLLQVTPLEYSIQSSVSWLYLEREKCRVLFGSIWICQTSQDSLTGPGASRPTSFLLLAFVKTGDTPDFSHKWISGLKLILAKKQFTYSV